MSRAMLGIPCAGQRWLRRGWVTRRHIDLQRVHSALCCH
jgi:hypothetical protein